MIKNRNISAGAAIALSKLEGGGGSLIGAGEIFYVAPATSALRNLWSERVPADHLFLTVATAYAKTVTGRNDVIVLSPDTHTLTSMLSITKDRVHIVGANIIDRYYGQRAKVDITATSGATNIATIQITGQGCSLTGLKIRNYSTVAEGLYALADGGEYTQIRACELYKATDLNEDGAAELLCNGDSSQYIGCTIGNTVDAITATGARPCVLFNRETITGKVARDTLFKDCIFQRKAGAAGNFFMYGSGATDIERMCLIEDCKFFNTKLAGATPAQSVGFGASQTQGYVLLVNPYSVGSATALSTTTGVFAIGPDCGADATSEGSAQMGIAIQCN